MQFECMSEGGVNILLFSLLASSLGATTCSTQINRKGISRYERCYLYQSFGEAGRDQVVPQLWVFFLGGGAHVLWCLNILDLGKKCFIIMRGLWYSVLTGGYQYICWYMLISVRTHMDHLFPTEKENLFLFQRYSAF